MPPVLFLIGGFMTGLAVGRRQITWLAFGVLAMTAEWFIPGSPRRWPIALAAMPIGYLVARIAPRRRRTHRSFTSSTADAHGAASWSDSGSSSNSDASWFGGGESGGGGASADWSGDSGGGDSGGGDSGGGDSGGGSSD
jgi:uncharacterized membrane protein YgcG